MHRRFIVTLCAILTVASAKAQGPLTPEVAEKANQILNNRTAGTRLRCRIIPINPFVDFEFRLDAGFVVRCPLKEFEGKESVLYTFVRVTPEGSAPGLLGARYNLPAVPAKMLVNLKKLKDEIEMSGGFMVGEGRYLVEAAVVDNRGRVYSKRWKIKAALHRGERAVPVALKARTVAPLAGHPWDGTLVAGGVRLTVLLDATPFSMRVQKLRAWDRALLLGSVSSLLRQTPSQSVRLMAFNLDQGRVIFQQDEFDRAGFIRLSQALEDLELGTVSYRVLQRQAWQELLVRLVHQEVTREEPSQAVVFLGPRSHFGEKIRPEMLKARETRDPQFFYFEYYRLWQRGSEFPDAIDYLTKSQGGMVFPIHSPGEFAQGIQKMLRQLKQE